MNDIRKHINVVAEAEPSLDVQGVVDSILDYKLHNTIKSKKHILELIKHFGSRYSPYKAGGMTRKKFISDVIDTLKARMNRYDYPEN